MHARTIYQLFLVTVLLWAGSLLAQTPTQFDYQSVVRNGSNELLRNRTIGLRITIAQGSPMGTVAFQETHLATTNINGLFTITVGAGTPVSGNIATIDWGNSPYYIVCDIDPEGGTSYAISSNQMLLTVPYAIYSEKCDETQTLSDVLTQNASAGNARISGVHNPVQPRDAVTLAYADSLINILTYNVNTPRRDVTIQICPNELPYVWRGHEYAATGNYRDTIRNACGTGCDSIIYLHLRVRPSASVTLTGITSSLGTTACVGTTPSLTAVVASSIGDLSYAWSSTSGADLTATDLATVTTEAIESGDNSYSVTVTATNVCGNTNANANITIAGGTPPSVTLSNITGSATVCLGGSSNLSVSPSSSSGSVSYAWTTENGANSGLGNSSTSSVTVTPTAIGNYTYTITATAQSAGCDDASDSKSFTVATFAQPSLTLGTPSEDDGTLTANIIASNGTLSYQWLKDGETIVGATNSSYTTSQSGDYSVVVTAAIDASGCNNAQSTSDEVSIVATPAGCPTAVTASTNTISSSNRIDVYANGVSVTGSDSGHTISYNWRYSETNDGCGSRTSGNISCISGANTNHVIYNRSGCSCSTSQKCRYFQCTITVTKDGCPNVSTVICDYDCYR